jgi:Concanavalin A-like lectin/glucanases superfamily/BNR repeat-containing family member
MRLLLTAGRRRRVTPSPFFASDPMLSPGWEQVSGPAAIYVASLHKTFVTWQFVGVGSNKGVHIAAYDHTGGTWSERYTLGNFVLADDDHGHPALVRDADGYFHCTFGSHANGAKAAHSVAPDDISAWTQNPDGGTNTSYHQLNLVGSAIYWTFRDDTDLNRRKLAVRSGTPVSGDLTYGSAVTLVDFGADSRVYYSSSRVVGTDIHFVAAKANAADTSRINVYYFIYKTATGALTNYNASTSTASGSLPVDLSTANTSYRLFAHGGSNTGEVPCLEFDSNGDAHVVFMDGTDGGSYAIKHIKNNAGTWSSPATIATITDEQTGAGFTAPYSLVAGPSGRMECWFAGSGMHAHRAIYSAGTWSGAQLIAQKASRNFLRAQPVRNADSKLRTIFSEVLPATDSGAGLIRLFAYGDGGPVNTAIDMGAVDASWSSVVLLLGFESKDASAACAIDDSPASFRAASFNGNAQIDIAQKKFGSASLLLDGTGDYLNYTHGAALSLSAGDITVEAWIRLSSNGRLQCICGKRPAVGQSEYAFYVNASNQLQLTAFNNSGAVVSVSGTTTLSTGTWYHVAASRSGSAWKIFVGGNQEASASESSAATSNSEPLLIGRDQSNTSRDFAGWIDELRITRAARYTSGFTAPTAAFPRR